MAEKPKCSSCNVRDATHKGLCSGCYGKQWREQRKAERARAAAESLPKQLTSGVTAGELEAIEGEIVSTELSTIPETHLTALNPAQMQAAQSDMKAWLEQKLSVLERDIVEANAALNEARRNGWSTAALTSTRNRAVDDETFYNKVLMAVEAGHTMIPDFPISIFAVRTQGEKPETLTWTQPINNDTRLHRPARPDCAPAGVGKFRNPMPEVQSWRGPAREDEKGNQYYPYFQRRTGRPIRDIDFPKTAARAPIMKATANAMADKAFDQFGICFPIAMTGMGGRRRIQTDAARPGDPLIIGQVVGKRIGNKQRVASFIIAWHLNLNEL